MKSKNNSVHYQITHDISELLKIQPSGQNICMLGRVINLRNNKMFVVLRFEGQDIQCLCDHAVIQAQNAILIKGNLLYVRGTYIFSNTQAPTVKVETLELVSPCVKQIHKEYFIDRSSEKYSRDIRVRQLSFSLSSFQLLNARFILMAEIRKFFTSKKFLEVDTPILQEIAGGAFAKPFKTCFLAKNKTFYLRIAPELYLKRLIIAGYSKVFEIAKNFRNEGLSAVHNPEFTMLEAYAVNCTIDQMITSVLELFYALAKTTVESLHSAIDKTCAQFILDAKIVHVSFKDFVEHEFSSIDIHSMASITPEIQKKYDLVCTDEYVYPEEYFYDILTKKILKQKYADCIVILRDQPAIISPLATATGKYAHRFEVYINSIEVADGFIEQNDFVKQEKIFQAFEELTGTPYDKAYIQDMMFGMYNTCGVGIGLDRLFCVLTNTSNIRDVIGWTS